ncbi:MAG: SdpI family protein [Lachnospiraceae bacterium]|nr:SdpI family protein [Lachnospiraceae bacterium]
MGFWVFMMCFALLIPVSMICLGRYFTGKAPAKINYVFGYRTSRSMKNEDTWKFAHQYFGRLWHKGGLFLLVVTVLAMLPVYGKSIDFVGGYASVLCILQMVVMMFPIFLTESALKKNFDQEGNRKREI